MRAVMTHELGGPDVLVLREAEAPTPRETDLLIEVHASGLNPVDTKIRRGGIPRPLPMVLGFDVSGVVREVGAAVKDFRRGDEVYASPNLLRDGSNAELVCVDYRTAAHKPRTLDHVQAAALPLVTLTAWEALHDRCRIQPGQTLLIHAGAGGVGHIAVQLAKLHGCRVITTASQEASIALCQRFGADVIINYAQEDVAERVKQETGGKLCPVVFDTIGGEVFETSLKCVGFNGQVVTILGTESPNIAKSLFRKNATLHYEFMGVPAIHDINPQHQGDILRQAADLVDAGRLTPHVSRVMTLHDVPEAHGLQESGHVHGKIVFNAKL